MDRKARDDARGPLRRKEALVEGIPALVPRGEALLDRAVGDGREDPGSHLFSGVLAGQVVRCGQRGVEGDGVGIVVVGVVETRRVALVDGLGQVNVSAARGVGREIGSCVFRNERLGLGLGLGVFRNERMEGAGLLRGEGRGLEEERGC